VLAQKFEITPIFWLDIHMNESILQAEVLTKDTGAGWLLTGSRSPLSEATFSGYWVRTARENPL